ncbi:C45 family peptidase [Leptospira barantonii]|nr:C45 family peptidase [Leptospira barantonii]
MKRQTHPLAILQLKGTQEEMGRQFGEIMQNIGQYDPIFDFYPVMARNLLLGSLPRNRRNFLAKGFLSMYLKFSQNQMRKHRPDEFSKRTIAALEAAGKTSKIEKDLFTMDAFQNSVGLLGLIQMLPELAHIGEFGKTQLVPACTSAAVWGNHSEDGMLYHARNFDFPGVDVWDLRPIVVFCTPTQGLRYGYITCRGADAPGITAFNEAGLTLSFHTRFHKKIGSKGLGVIDFGHKIISEAHNIAQAVEIAQKHKINSTWGAIVTSCKEKGSKAAVIETNFGDVDVTYSQPGGESFVNTNHYLSPRLQNGEILASPVFNNHTVGRYKRAHQILAETRSKGTSVKNLQELLSDTIDPSSGESRIMGSTIRQITSVKSVVMSPEAGKLYVSIGVAPTGDGPYLEIPISWEKNPGYKIVGPNEISNSKNKTGKKKTTTSETAIEYYKNAMLINDDPKLGGVNEIFSELGKAKKISSKDPSISFLQAILKLETGEWKEAIRLLEESASFESGSFRKNQANLWLARTHSAIGLKKSANHYYQKVLNGPNTRDELVWKQKAISDNGSYSKRKLKQISPNFLLVDVNEL